MSGPITSILAAVTARLTTATGGTATTTGDRTEIVMDDARTLVVLVGRKYLAESDSFPRVVWFPDRETADRASGSSEDRTDDLPRVLWRRRVRLVAQCWGADIDDAEALANTLAVAFHDASQAEWEYSPVGGAWDDTSGSSAWLTSGEALTHAYDVFIPVTVPPEPTTTQGPPVITETINV